MHVQSCCFALSSYCLFDFLVAAAFLTSYYLRYIVMSHKKNILGAYIELLLLIASQTFFRLIGSSFVSELFWLGPVENKSFPCSRKLGERTGQAWLDISHLVRTHKKNSTLGNFCANFGQASCPRFPSPL